ncbi:hypothetical protein PDIG_89270 [Penicillium digitatum PHI26]|uniref:Uncharacterized protein n=2 Tax=Penicillium digitatum TaxID=36651 RepID=K9FTP6_PEND2|nr:hypothetical protein PDIP_03540 [Penicillium digitatum Pd1]EKV04431.1 hypothetical protein PDIG_89270 [Penicillium digitatum PHI26]EKV21725.1 hypothetical protein PDIP_03540 [Penicillium digitatum Pd1]
MQDLHFRPSCGEAETTQNETGDLPSLNKLEDHGSLTFNLYLPDMPYIGHIIWGQPSA